MRRLPKPTTRVLGSSLVLGLVVALAAWGVEVLPPSIGLDYSWQAALYMAAHRGLLFGPQVVFTYGPLGFLAAPGLWYDGLAVLAFVYSSALYIALSASLVWCLRRALHPVLAVVLTYLLLVATPAIEVPVALVTIWCLAALAPGAPPAAERLARYGGAALGGLESLVLLRAGPLILAISALTLLVGEQRRRRLASFVGTALLTFVAAWFAAGQTIGNLPSYIAHGSQIILGYSQAMGAGALPNFEIVGTAMVGCALVAAAALGSREGRVRWVAGTIVAVAAFALFKEAIVREDHGHLQIYFSTIVAIGAGVCFGRRRAVAMLAALILLVVAIAMPRSPSQPVQYSPTDHINLLTDQVREVVSPRHTVEVAEFGMALAYRIDPATLALLRGHRVDVDPWEAAVAWLYKLDWDPLPVFQNYSAYTSTLDHLNANALASSHGPQRVLRENIELDDPSFARGYLDSRLPAWDPPLQTIAMLCHYAALRTTKLWQVLTKVGDRCGALRSLGSVQIGNGKIASLPPAPAGQLLIGRIEGAGVSGSERIGTLLYRAKMRFLVVNGTHVYRLVPGTIADGLLLDVPPSLDFPAPFRVSPGARTIKLRGLSGTFTVRLYLMSVRPAVIPGLAAP